LKPSCVLLLIWITASRLTQARGLKLFQLLLFLVAFVAPHAGAWIETPTS